MWPIPAGTDLQGRRGSRGGTHLPGGGCSSVRSVRSMPRTLRSITSSLSTGRSALLPACGRRHVGRRTGPSLSEAGAPCSAHNTTPDRGLAQQQRGVVASLATLQPHCAARAPPLLHPAAARARRNQSEHLQPGRRARRPPEGSPTRPVAPPSSATGTWPQRWNHASTMMPSRLPRCRLSAVGSKPQYASSCSWVLAAPSSGEVTSCSRPRERSTSTTSRSCGAGGAAPADAGCSTSVAAAAATRRLLLLLDRPRQACCEPLEGSATRGLQEHGRRWQAAVRRKRQRRRRQRRERAASAALLRMAQSLSRTWSPHAARGRAAEGPVNTAKEQAWPGGSSSGCCWPYCSRSTDLCDGLR